MATVYKIFLFGLDNAGKSTLLKFMREGTIDDNLRPTREFNMMEIFINDISYIIWDAPGQKSYRERWQKRLNDTTTLLFILDVSDKERFNEAKEILDNLLSEEDVKGVPLIICFHKHDLKESQDNMKDAGSSLSIESIKNREVYWIKTSVFNEDEVEDLKVMLFQLSLRFETQKSLAEIQKKNRI